MAEPESIREEKERHHYVVQQLADFYGPLLEASSDGVMIYLDDEHKTCNQKLAEMFGYAIEEWTRTFPFIDTFIAPESRAQIATTYRNVRDKGVSARFELTCRRRDGSTFRADMAMVPILAGDDFFTLNLFRKL